MKKYVIVLGAGGHAKVVIELLHESGYQVDFCVGEEGSPKNCLGIPVLLGEQNLIRLRDDGYVFAFPAIGSNFVRERAAIHAVSLGYELVNAISHRAVVSPSAALGVGIAIMGGVIINAECKIENLTIINTGTTVDHGCHIGDCAHIAPQCALAGDVKVGRRVFLGIGTIVIPNIKIGDDATTGAGSVVISNLPASTTVVGHPAKPLKNS